MSWVSIDWRPSAVKVRQFAAGLMLLAPLALWLWSAPAAWIAIAAISGALAFAVSWPAPGVVAPIYTAACLVAAPIGMVVGEVALLVIFFGVVTPLAFINRWLGRRRLEKAPDPDCSSYWEEVPEPPGPDRYFRPY